MPDPRTILIIATALIVAFLWGFHFGSRAAFRAIQKALDEQNSHGGPHV